LWVIIKTPSRKGWENEFLNEGENDDKADDGQMTQFDD